MTNIYWESVIMAWESIAASKLRSLLTMLGIIIGVAAVIALMSIGYGVRQDIENNISSLGSNLLTVSPGTSRKPGVRPAAGSLETLTYKDYLAVKNLPNIAYSSPMVRSSYVVVAGNKNWTTQVYGVTAEYKDVASLGVSEGRYWTQQEFDGRERVAVVGKTIADNLFGGESPIGQKIRINNDPFTVIGVLEEKGYSFQDQDDRILCPFTTVQERMMGITYINSISLTTVSSGVMSQAETDITNLLRTRHRLAAGAENDFSISNSQDILETMESTTQSLTIFLGSIAAISLIVGGIGIMNIMLVSVTERTREIGIRMAIGARKRDIIGQFLVEAAVVSCCGGIIGIVLGCFASAVLGRFMLARQLQQNMYLPNVEQFTVLPSVGLVLGAFLFSALLGIIFGLYPANKASNLQPVDALRTQ